MEQNTKNSSSSEKKNNQDNNWLLRYIFAVFLISLLVNMGMYLPIPTLDTLEAGNWLDFWGGYLGGVLGCIPAFAALHESRRQAKQQHEEVQEQLEESRRQARKQYEEAEKNRRLSVQPIFGIELVPMKAPPSSVSDIELRSAFDFSSGLKTLDTPIMLPVIRTLFNQYQNGQAYIILRNLGFGPALDVKLVYEEFENAYRGSVDFRIIDKGETSKHLFLYRDSFPQENQKEKVAHFFLVYRDIFENQYKQPFKLLVFSNTFVLTSPSSPSLIYPKTENTTI